MRTDNIKVKLTIPIPFNKPDLNGVVYPEQAVENAVNNLQKIFQLYTETMTVMEKRRLLE